MQPKQPRQAVIIASVVLLAILPQTHAQTPSKSNVSAQLTIIGFTLGKNTIADVEATLGASAPGQCANTEGASREICYASPDSDKTTIFFEAGVSGGWTQLDAFRITSRTRNANCSLECRTSKAVGSEIQTRGGLKLGLTRTEVANLLGTPVRTVDDKLSFEWQSRRQMTKKEIAKSGQNPATHPFWNIVDTIDVIFANSKVVEFKVRHAVSD